MSADEMFWGCMGGCSGMTWDAIFWGYIMCGIFWGCMGVVYYGVAQRVLCYGGAAFWGCIMCGIFWGCMKWCYDMGWLGVLHFGVTSCMVYSGVA